MCPSAFIHRPISPGSQHSPGTAFPSVTWLWLVWFGDPDHVRSPGGVKFTPPHVLMYHSVRYTTLHSRIIHLWNILYIPSDDGIYTTFEYTFEIYTSEGAFGASEQNNTPVEYTFGIYDLYSIQGVHPLIHTGGDAGRRHPCVLGDSHVPGRAALEVPRRTNPIVQQIHGALGTRSQAEARTSWVPVPTDFAGPLDNSSGACCARNGPRRGTFWGTSTRAR